jgi:hypothetical protein
MDETNIRELKSPYAEAQKIEDALKPLGFDVHECNIKPGGLGSCNFIVHLGFVGLSDISGDDIRFSAADGEEAGS